MSAKKILKILENYKRGRSQIHVIQGAQIDLRLWQIFRKEHLKFLKIISYQFKVKDQS